MDKDERELFLTRRLVAVRKGSIWTHYKRHHDDEFFDRVEFALVPRYKMSDLSGDEWRVSAVARYFCKDVVVIERGYTKMEHAIVHAPWVFRTAFEEPGTYDEDAFSKLQKELWDGTLCLQPGCSAKATKVYQLLAEYSREGFKSPLEGDERYVVLRAFCDQHATRGDCGLEDADANYKAWVDPESKVSEALKTVDPFGER